MNFDFSKTLALVKGGLLEREATWNSYLQDCPEWKATAVVLTGPMLVANVLLGTIFGRISGGYMPYGHYGNVFTAIFWGLVLATIGFVIAVLVFNFLAGSFQGKSDFSRAFAGVSLAAIPAWLAGMIAPLLPGFVGVLVSLAGGITSLVFMYKIMPVALAVPDEKRVLHFVVSLIVIVVANMLVGGLVGAGSMGGMRGMGSSHSGPFGDDGTYSTAPASGVLGEIARQGQLMEAAGADEYQPPEDGKLSSAQVRNYAKVMAKARALQAEQQQKLDKVSEELKQKEESGEFSLSDLATAYSSVGSVLSSNNAEMEIVKTSGGNWAEYSWVKNQLRTARIQRGEGNSAIEHNFKLYEQYRDEIGEP